MERDSETSWRVFSLRPSRAASRTTPPLQFSDAYFPKGMSVRGPLSWSLIVGENELRNLTLSNHLVPSVLRSWSSESPFMFDLFPAMLAPLNKRYELRRGWEDGLAMKTLQSPNGAQESAAMSLFGKNLWPEDARQGRTAGTRTVVKLGLSWRCKRAFIVWKRRSSALVGSGEMGFGWDRRRPHTITPGVTFQRRSPSTVMGDFSLLNRRVFLQSIPES